MAYRAIAVVAALTLLLACGGNDPVQPDGRFAGLAGASSGGASAAGSSNSSAGANAGAKATGGAPGSGGSTGNGGSSSAGAGNGNGGGSAGQPATKVLPCEREFQLEGVRACESQFEGYQVKFVPLAAGKHARAVSVYFHGDTAVDWEEDWGYAALASWSFEHDVAFFAARAEAWASNPGEDPWRVWYNTDEAGSLAVARVIDTFAAAYLAPADGVLYAGSSGGSIYLTGGYLPRVGQLHPGVFVANCGADEPKFMADFAWNKADTALRNKFSLYFYYGSNDFLAEQIADSFQFFTDNQFMVEREIVEGAGHCEIDSDKKTIELWERHL